MFSVECRAKPDMAYLSTLPGMLKILIIILNILVFFCVAIGGPGYYAGKFLNNNQLFIYLMFRHWMGYFCFHLWFYYHFNPLDALFVPRR